MDIFFAEAPSGALFFYRPAAAHPFVCQPTSQPTGPPSDKHPICQPSHRQPLGQPAGRCAVGQPVICQPVSGPLLRRRMNDRQKMVDHPVGSCQINLPSDPSARSRWNFSAGQPCRRLFLAAASISQKCSRGFFCRLGTPYAAPIRHLYDGDHFNRIQLMNFSAGRPNDLLNL